MFAPPIPTISWFASTFSPRRAAKLAEVAIWSVRETSTMPKDAARSGPRDSSGTDGNVRLGNPWGSGPTTSTPLAARSRTPVTTVAPRTATSTAGTFLVTRGSRSRTARVARPIASAVVLVWSSPSRNALISSKNPSASVENPNSFGSWPTMMVTARPFM